MNLINLRRLDMFKRYANPEAVGYLGWFECGGKVSAFVNLDRTIVFVEEIDGYNA